MNAAPFFKCYPSDFLNGIADMGPNEIAVYTVVIMRLYDEGGKVLDDDQKIARRCNMRRPACRKAIDQLVSDGKLQRNEQYLTHKRVTKEIQKRTEMSAKQSRNAQRREHEGSKRPNENNDDDQNWHSQKGAESKPSRDQKPETRSQRKKELPNGSSQKGTRISKDWEPPTGWVEIAIGLGLPRANAVSELDRFKDYWVGVPGQRGIKLDWEATWRNWVRRSLENIPEADRGKDTNDIEALIGAYPNG